MNTLACIQHKNYNFIQPIEVKYAYLVDPVSAIE